MRPVVGGGIDAGGEALHEEDRRSVETGRVAGDCDRDDDRTHGPERREQ
jgi:hypothetical protein